MNNTGLLQELLNTARLIVPLIVASVATAQAPKVNERTLNCFLRIDLIELPCFVGIEFELAYNSYAGDSADLGRKWQHSHAVSITEEFGGLVLMESDGFSNRHSLEASLNERKAQDVETVLSGLREADRLSGGLRSEATYRELRQQLSNDSDRRESTLRMMLEDVPAPGGVYRSNARGASIVIKNADGTYTRRLADGVVESFCSDGRMSSSVDLNGNRIRYEWNGGLLRRIEDACGRFLVFSHNEHGHIDSIVDSFGRKWDFSYQEDLLAGIESSNARSYVFEYQRPGYLTRLLVLHSPDGAQGGRVTEYVMSYNKRLEIETFATEGTVAEYRRTHFDRSGNEASDVTDHSLTVVSFFNDQGELAGSEHHEQVLGVFSRHTTFGADGTTVRSQTTHFDPASGLPTSVRHDGAETRYEYESSTGRVMQKSELPGNRVTSYDYDGRTSRITRVRESSPDGQIETYEYSYNHLGNLTHVRHRSGSGPERSLVFSHDERGRTVLIEDSAADGRTIRFSHSDVGRPDLIELKDVGAVHIEYSRFGELQSVDTVPAAAGISESEALAEIRRATKSIVELCAPGGVSLGI